MFADWLYTLPAEETKNSLGEGKLNFSVFYQNH